MFYHTVAEDTEETAVELALNRLRFLTRNKTRSLLTAFGVFWGIFMLVALIGGGQGLEYMLKKNFEGFATNSGFLASQRTGEAYKGFRKGRWWNLESTDIERLRSQVKEVEVITPSVARWGSKAVYEDKKYDCSVKGLYPDHLIINPVYSHVFAARVLSRFEKAFINSFADHTNFSRFTYINFIDKPSIRHFL